MYRKIHDACVNDHKIIGYVGHGFSLFAINLLLLSLFISALNFTFVDFPEQFMVICVGLSFIGMCSLFTGSIFIQLGKYGKKESEKSNVEAAHE